MAKKTTEMVGLVEGAGDGKGGLTGVRGVSAPAGETTPTPPELAERTLSPLERAMAEVERVANYGDVREWRTNLSPDVAETIAKAEEFAKANPDSTAGRSGQARLAGMVADLDKRRATWLKEYQAQQEAIAAYQAES